MQTDIDPLVSSPSRLAIVCALANTRTLSFAELNGVVKGSVGSLSAHLRRLEDAGYVAVDRGFVDRKPRRSYSLTASGRKALKRYLETMAKLIADVNSPEEQ